MIEMARANNNEKPPTGRPRKKTTAAAPQKPAEAPRPTARGRKRVDPAPAALLPKRTEKQKPAVKKAAPAARTDRRAKTPRKTRASISVPPPTGSQEIPRSDEEQIEAAKYLSAGTSPVVFEDEKFIFPESYGVNRVRLLVRDPDWLFAHWDVDAAVVDNVRREIGRRALALSRLTLRLVDPDRGGERLLFLPDGARNFYIRIDRQPRSYRAVLGLTLTNGEFRVLAESNTISAPRSTPSKRAAKRRVHYAQAPLLAAAAELHTGWEQEPAAAADLIGELKAQPGEPEAPTGGSDPSGGASDVYRR